MNSLEKIEQALDQLTGRLDKIIFMDQEGRVAEIANISSDIEVASAYIGDGAVDTACGIISGTAK